MHLILVLLPDAPDDAVCFLADVSFEVTKSKVRLRRRNSKSIDRGDRRGGGQILSAASSVG